MEKERCSYCNGTLKREYGFNPFTNPTIYKCRRWHCDLLKKIGIYKLNWGQTNYGKPIKRILLKLVEKVNF